MDELSTRLMVRLSMAVLSLTAVPALTWSKISLLISIDQTIVHPTVDWAIVKSVAPKLFSLARTQLPASVCPPLPAQCVSCQLSCRKF